MPFDLAHHIGAVTRTVTSGTRDGNPVRTVIATRTYDTDPADLWDALTNPVRIPRWFLPVSGDLRLGGRYQFEGNAGGEITGCEPHNHLAATWEFGGGVTWLTVTLAPAAGGTLLTLEHTATVDEGLWAMFGPGGVGIGWDIALMNLGRHLATGEEAGKDEDAWRLGPEGRDFVRRTSAGWGEAAIAGGDEPAAARAAAERTRVVYTDDTPEA